MLHGGAIFALADAVFSAASNSHGTLAVAINVSISYFKAVNSGALTATAEEASFNPRLATYLITVQTRRATRSPCSRARCTGRKSCWAMSWLERYRSTALPFLV